MTRTHLVALSGVLLGVTAGVAAAAPHVVGQRAEAPRCSDAERTELSVPVGFDEVRVFVGGSSPGAAAAVTVLAGNSDRRVTAFGRGRWALAMSEPLPAGRVVVAVEPVLDAPAPACVERVELVRGGAVIAATRP
jgi:hypothetical protein